MWLPVLVLLGLWNGAFAVEDEVCQLRAERRCDIHSIIPDGLVPGNIEDLNKDCLNLYQVKQCVADTIRNCSSENAANNENAYNNNEVDDGDRERVKDMNRLIDLTTQICDENSELHRNFVPHMSCLKSSFQSQNEQTNSRDCPDKALDSLKSRIEGKARSMAGGNERRFQEVRNELVYCLHILFRMNCVILQSMRDCGTGVKQPMLEIIEKAGSLDEQCPASSRIDVIELLDALKLASRQEIYIAELVRVDFF